jgi:C6 transcription factor Pro1
MYKRSNEGSLENTGLVEKSRTILSEDHPITEYEAQITEEIATFRFVSGAIIWLDTLSSITAGTTPHLLPYYSHIIVPNSQAKLQTIMGCKDSVILLLGRIAAIYEQKVQASKNAAFDCSHLEQRVDEISGEIQCSLTQVALEGFNIYGSTSPTMFNIVLDPKRFITQLYLHMASIYFHLLSQGFQNLVLLDTTISGAMNMLRVETSRNLLPSLVCPLFFIGCVAREEEKQFFRDVFSMLPLLDPLLKHRGRVLPFLEEIWSKRTTVLGFGWEDCVELTKNILLI